ncbi:MAG: chemotaxis protein CheA [Candidatus Acididesulfobacter diazotrophicus]|jgi:two-component system chemotaxis sensor kinase CheA|uniref:histidine kinase n=1 Tax=Candidatus Acididesulfobacter diazotrophicus TaxID=2597226 RepID=A0A519BMV4_9DELT|nr:MAG: chemotaxis protein CheA [Candidatus Acididesulfobacter diazotrophicus]
MIDDSMKEIINDFVQEALELLDTLSENFIELEKNPEDKELLNTIFRAAHTIKGSAGFLGFQNLVELAHSAENILNKLRQGEIKLTSDMMDYLLKTMDILTLMIRNINDTGEEGNFDNAEIINKLNMLALDEGGAGNTAAAAELNTAAEDIEKKAEAEAQIKIQEQNEEKAKKKENHEDKDNKIEEIKLEEPLNPTNKANNEKHPKRKVRNLGDILLEDNLMSSDELSQILKEKEKEEKKIESIEIDSISNIANMEGTAGGKEDNNEKEEKTQEIETYSDADIKEENIINKTNNHEDSNKTVKLNDSEKQTPPLHLSPPSIPAESKKTDSAAQVLSNIVPPQPQMHPTVSVSAETTIRVDVERLDNVMNLVGELVLSRNRIFNIASKLEFKYPEDEFTESLIQVVSNLNLITTDLQLAVMRTRMQPVKKVFSKFPRMVRDLSKELGKEIELNIAGEETELDKSVIEEIGDPLVHLIRNSIDHGIEMPEDRIKAGKPKAGSIKLSAEHEGNYIIIEVSDDGKGMDPNILRKKAIEKGLIDEKTAFSISDKDALSLIFAPGFSTKDKVTEISGRGVGMDVVKTNIQKLNGIIDIESEKGKGSDIILKLPLTVAIIQTLIIGIEDEIFAIPLNSVVETLRISESSIQTIDNHEVINLRKSVLSLLRLSEEFGIESASGSVSEGKTKVLSNKEVYVVVVALAEKRIGIVVDTLYGQEEVVIKSLGDYQFGYKGISGATITGDGKVVLIMDIASMIDILQKR